MPFNTTQHRDFVAHYGTTDGYHGADFLVASEGSGIVLGISGGPRNADEALRARLSLVGDLTKRRDITESVWSIIDLRPGDSNVSLVRRRIQVVPPVKPEIRIVGA